MTLTKVSRRYIFLPMEITTTQRNTWKVEGEMFGQITTIFESADLFECLRFVAEND